MSIHLLAWNKCARRYMPCQSGLWWWTAGGWRGIPSALSNEDLKACSSYEKHIVRLASVCETNHGRSWMFISLHSSPWNYENIQWQCRWSWLRLFSQQIFQVVPAQKHEIWGVQNPSPVRVKSKNCYVILIVTGILSGFRMPTWDYWDVWYLARWWFQIFFIFTPIWGRFPFWLIFFKGVETTNQDYWDIWYLDSSWDATLFFWLTTLPRGHHSDGFFLWIQFSVQK